MSDDLYEGDETSPFLTHFIGRVKTGFWSNFFAETEGKTTGDFAHDTVWFSHVDVLDILQTNYEASGPPLETMSVSLGIGKGWMQDPANPNLIMHDDDTDTKKKKIRAETAYMRVLYLIGGKIKEYEDALVLDGDSPNITYDMSGVRKVHADRGLTTVRDATLYDGCIFEYRGLGFVTRNTPKPRAKPWPVRYLGYDDSEVVDLSTLSGVGDSRTNSPEAARSTLGSVPPAVLASWQEAGASDPTIDVLTRVYESSPSLDHFVANAGHLPAVKENEKLAATITDTEVAVATAETAAE